MRDPTTTARSLISLGQLGDRARPIQAQLDQAVLVIGVGRVGMHAITRLNTMLDSLLTRRERQSNLRLLAIARRRSLREEAALPRELRLSLEMEALPWSDVPGRYASMGVPQWWPHSPGTRDILSDPMRVRAYNRLLLFDNAALVGETLFRLVQWLHEVGTGRELDLQRRIYVIGSLAEPEGSGLVFDVATRLRALCAGRPATILGVFSLRDHPDDGDPERTLAMANVYAALRELDAVTLQPELYPSPLPVIGHTLLSGPARPALDAIYLTDDATALSAEPPDLALAEFTATWIAGSLVVPERTQALPAAIPRTPGSDRFSGYCTFGVSKAALPTHVAMDLAAIGLAQAGLRAIRTANAAVNPAAWINAMAEQARAAVWNTPLQRASPVIERQRMWTQELSGGTLLQRLESRSARGETVTLLGLAQMEWRRLERELLTQDLSEQGTVNTVPDSLRMRIEQALAAGVAEVRAALIASPPQLAYREGLGLAWAASALEGLEQALGALTPELLAAESEASAAYQLSRDAFFATADQFDGRGASRGRGGRRPAPPELNARSEVAVVAAVEWSMAQVRLAVWHELCALAGDLAGQVREVAPLTERTASALGELEAVLGQAMAEAAGQPTPLPAAALLVDDWYKQGIRNIASMAHLPPQQLVQRLYEAWGSSEPQPDRQLRRFIVEILHATRRALAGLYNFMDLYEFVSVYGNAPAFQQVLAKLPTAATPTLIPTVDDTHPAPARFEIVREIPRPFSVLSVPAAGVQRIGVPSPDPDEVTVIRLLHGVMAEALPALRETYRRAYDRAGAEGIPLHIDRRWDATMADLVHTTARREISVIWEALLQAVRTPGASPQLPLEALIRAFALALDVEETVQHPQATPPDMRLVVFKLRPFRLKLPPPHCAVLFLFSNRSAEELGPELLAAIAPLPLEEQFAFVVNVIGRPDIDAVLEPLRHVDFTVLELQEAAVKHLIGARLPTRALSDYVLDQVSLTTVSPFYTRGPVPEHMFFGREREINEVRSKLRTHSVALIGGRRIGKTSTLQRIQRLLEPQESEYKPFYLDCHGATNYRSFFWLINRRWGVNIAPDAHPVQFEEVIEALAAQHRHKAIAILFDEVDSLMLFDRQPENQETLFRTFRSLSNEKRCQFIFSGEKWLMRAIADPYSALFNFTQAVRLEPLPPKVIHRLVAEPFEMLNIWIEQSEQVITRIYQISAGHPNIVQMICQAMVEELDQTPQNASLLTLDQLDRATSRRTLQEEIVQTIWGQMNPLARLITLIWPEGERFLTLAQIEALLAEVGVQRIPPERLERTAKDLELYCFVRPRERDRLELIPMAFPAILDFMTDKRRQIQITRQHYETDSQTL